jgi:hypothetical protein
VIIVAVLVRCRAYAATNCGEAAALRNVRAPPACSALVTEEGRTKWRRSGSQRAPMDGVVGNGKVGILNYWRLDN